MKILNRYIIESVLKILFITIFLTTLLLLIVDLFSNFDSYAQNNVSMRIIFNITIKYLPEAIIIVLPPATLFSITFFLSQMFYNNEIIALLSSGISLRSIYKPIVIMMLIVSSLAFISNEIVVLQSTLDRQQLKNKIFNINYNLDNTNIGLIDSLNNNIIYANSYVEKNKTLYDVIIVQKDEFNNVIARYDCKKAVYNDDNKDWILFDVVISNIKNDNVEIVEAKTYENRLIALEPNLFRNLSSDLATMQLSSAIKYLNIQKKVNLRLWYENLSQFLERISAPFAAFIMTIIACSIDYKGKKNVFLFSIFNSVIIAVIYYVSKMVFQLVSKQGLINPFIGVLIPYFIVLLVPLILNSIKKYTRS